MSVRDMLLALCVVVIWGVNFVVIKVGLHGMPPLLLGALRFIFVVIPAIFFIPRPKIPLKGIVIYGLTISFAQFAFLFCAINLGMPSGIASVVLQSQVFFSVLLGALILGEKVKRSQIVGILLAAAGMFVLAKGGMTGNLTDIPLIALLFTLAAGFSWACGNITNRSIMQNAGTTSIMSLVVWSALVPILPFLLCSWLFEGQAAIENSLANIHLPTILALCYIAFLSTHVGYGLWGRLLTRYETWRVTPFALLVPVVGLTSGALILGEKIASLQIYGLLLIMLGLLINVFGGRMMTKRIHCPAIEKD
ncbi:MAG: EamA family transporter [Hafnia sp.]|uniref:EamA family transporter n=1 Tax=Hafnia paralvei TaxID=546367 RepID=UPI000BB56F6C|nr:EamA family transporter [Hafnia paralvei]MCE9946540.1 EamA family transporter [Hafnia paralvei]PNK69284.1 O-acetylserine/cysteine exporter [Hafnia paralvei]